MGLNSWEPALDAMEQAADTYIGHTSRLNIDHVHQGDMIREQGLVRIDSMLARLVGIEENLKASRILLQGIRNTSVTLVPINRLPTDVLAMVVIAGYEDLVKEEIHEAEGDDDCIFNSEYEIEEDDPGDPNHFPTTFSHVCRRWRDVALGTAAVWTHFVFEGNGSYDRVATWMSRTKQSNLSLELRRVNLHRAMEILRPNMSRVTSLVLYTFNGHSLVEGLKHFIAHDRPPLKQLKLLTRHTTKLLVSKDFSEEEWVALMDMMRGLEHVHLWHVFFPLECPAYWGLKTLHLHTLQDQSERGGPTTEAALLTIFQQSPDLERVTLIGVESLRQVPAQSPPVVLRKLKIFSVQEYMSLQLTSFILSALSTPALEKFTLSYDAPPSPGSELQQSEFPALLTFFKNSRPASLKSLSLTAVGRGHVDLHLDQILAYTPGLEFLWVKGGRGFGTPALQGMLDPKRLAPRLERLWLRGCAFSAQLLKDLVLQRNSFHSGCSIRNLVIKNCKLDGLDSTILPILEGKVEELEWEYNSCE